MAALTYIDPVNDLGSFLLNVEKPSRYVGGEYGILLKENKPEAAIPASDNSGELKTVIAFPDLYEIGMGNQATRIIYNRMNNISGVSCDRAFTPAPDFEKLLREKKIPLYGLETGISLASADMLMFTLGYELGLNGILTILDVSGIPLHIDKRNKEEFPIIIAGGPAVSNPLPYSPFIDAFWIGEAEAGFFDLARELSDLKKAGQSRAALFEKIASRPNVWVKGKKKAERAIHCNFENNPIDIFPVPSMKTIHHHGSIEIMRGCPNGCRFCHAGFWYRPCRQKDKKTVIEQAEKLVKEGGWQEISLSSLSTGDYLGIDSLIETLNEKYKDDHVSFQLPSLKIQGFALSLLKKISVTRKSGLTFAVETPLDLWQIAVNKEVSRDSILGILEQAKKNGWKTAKFYFMIGLPKPRLSEGQAEYVEEEEIVSFIKDIGQRSRTRFNINIGVFIPKPHTPYQWAAQIDILEADKKINFIRSKLKPLGHKISASDLLTSLIEGLLSRGDAKAGLLCEEAFKSGSRLDPWSEYINKEKWRQIFTENSEYIKSILSDPCKQEKDLPWSFIESKVTEDYLRRELDNSVNPKRTPSCIDKCENCGVCDTNIKLSKKPECGLPETSDCLSKIKNENYVNQVKKEVNINIKKADPSLYRMLFSFSKEKSTVFHGHLSLIEIFSMSLRRADIKVNYTQGFNPLAKMEFASSLSTGISAYGEIALVEFFADTGADNFKNELNKKLPDGFLINNAECFQIKSGMKKHSLASLLWGFKYQDKNGNIEYVNAKNEKVYRQNIIKNNASIFKLSRLEVLAKNILDNSREYMSYFDAYRFLYK
ncbi:MAG: TIGR03936 family radical SAM-associated protein [Treponema sp.]|nr:TIGR03936 family radical SAM-associated protein [Treponema sp.]